MKKFCPYCQSDLDDLNVVKERALEWSGDIWIDDPKAISAIQCPECGDELDATDLGILGIPAELIKIATKA